MSPEEYFDKAKSTLNLPKETKLTSAYAFGLIPDKLAQLVINGIKTGTTSAYDLYEKDEPLPKIGEYDVILDGNKNPVCITYTDSVEIKLFNDVDAEHAFKEGEGDKSLKYWRKVHKDFFENEYRNEGSTFNPRNSKMVLEHFHVIYK
ncbi:ASCH domain-containing protein [Apilactobacillus timberlakei]|uniref:ASCH domain-containing protein n=1 Tax=Apilactobacillus timberlakei TaxID=2008380 RepID=A0ABY2YTD8_9LACO|nr:ASCH domain-containing protein [Apilactobacillus timberlakei]TPR13294.1 ASCH domain-containing protein [Apilactobacillus timberlakei]TPR14339.1 ASCH domain-containing protein [Apilactobacillus timberlakei]TPR16592.1 ASCH domain-containing protein [Apilactobacillus timberlakei]